MKDYVIIETQSTGEMLVHAVGERHSMLIRANLLQIAFSSIPSQKSEYNVYSLDAMEVSPNEIVTATQAQLERLVKNYVGVLETL